MAITFLTGPEVVSGQSAALNGYTPDYNADLGPSLAWGGMGFLDPRFGINQQPQSGQAAAIGYGGGYIDSLDAIPSASSVNNITASAVPVAGTHLHLHPPQRLRLQRFRRRLLALRLGCRFRLARWFLILCLGHSPSRGLIRQFRCMPPLLISRALLKLLARVMMVAQRSRCLDMTSMAIR